MTGKSLTVSIKDDVTTASVTPPALIFARTGAPNPIEESCRLQWTQKHTQFPRKNYPHHVQCNDIEIITSKLVLPFRDCFFYVNKGTPTDKEYILCVNLWKT